jgi:hypothetical protein
VNPEREIIVYKFCKSAKIRRRGGWGGGRVLRLTEVKMVSRF